MLRVSSLLFGLLVLPFIATAQSNYYTGQSDLVSGVKYPNSIEEGIEPVVTFATSPRDPADLKGFNTMVPWVLASPNQEDAGSCLYMSLTGIAEMWLSALRPGINQQPDGPVDLSERYMMNIAGLSEATKHVKSWRTDSIYLFNAMGYSVLNSEYRFTKSWYTEDSNGKMVAAQEGPDAKYGARYNWISELDEISGGQVPLPEFEREMIFEDPESNQWNVGVAPDDIVEQVKEALEQKQAPVHVLYNHFGYWHAVNIVGFDDDLDSEGCKFVDDFRKYMKKQPEKYRDAARKELNYKKRSRLLKLAKKQEKVYNRLEGSISERGFCRPKGMFYVRDSLYVDPLLPVYDYDTANQGEESNYTKKVIFREYDWLTHLSNHVSQIYVK